jgi:AcrR family transcriptional regulator
MRRIIGYCLYIAAVAHTESTFAAPRYRDRPRLAQLPGGPHGLSRAEVVASQRRRIMQAMVEVVGAQGYAGAQMREVIARSGVSRKTFYEQFDSKEGCLLAIYDEAAQCLRGVVQSAYERGVTPQERIDAALGILFEWIDSEPEAARVCILEVPSSGLPGRRRIATTLTWLTGVMADVLGDLDVPELLPELFVGGIHQMVVHRLVDHAEDLPSLALDLNEVWLDVEDRWR